MKVIFDQTISGQYKMQTADCRLQIGFKMQTRYKIQTAFVASFDTRYVFNI